MKREFDFTLKKNTFSNIFYPWLKTSKIFNWYSIFDNCYILDGTSYLKDERTSLLYTPNGKNNFGINILYGF